MWDKSKCKKFKASFTSNKSWRTEKITIRLLIIVCLYFNLSERGRMHLKGYKTQICNTSTDLHFLNVKKMQTTWINCFSWQRKHRSFCRTSLHNWWITIEVSPRQLAPIKENQLCNKQSNSMTPVSRHTWHRCERYWKLMKKKCLLANSTSLMDWQLCIMQLGRIAVILHRD